MNRTEYKLWKKALLMSQHKWSRLLRGEIDSHVHIPCELCLVHFKLHRNDMYRNCSDPSQWCPIQNCVEEGEPFDNYERHILTTHSLHDNVYTDMRSHVKTCTTCRRLIRKLLDQLCMVYKRLEWETTIHPVKRERARRRK